MIDPPLLDPVRHAVRCTLMAASELVKSTRYEHLDPVYRVKIQLLLTKIADDLRVLSERTRTENIAAPLLEHYSKLLGEYPDAPILENENAGLFRRAERRSPERGDGGGNATSEPAQFRGVPGGGDDRGSETEAPRSSDEILRYDV